MTIIWRSPKSTKSRAGSGRKTRMVRFEVKLERKKQMKAGFAKNSGPYKVTDPFEAKGLVRYEHRGLVDYTCSKKSSRSGLVSVYARLGLHRYNFLNGTNYKLNRVEKYNQSTGSAASSYFITLVPQDPTSSSPQTFQTRVNEKSYGKLDLTCSIARPRPRGDTLTCSIARPRGDTSSCIGRITKVGSLRCHRPTLYDCPPQNPFEQFYNVNESELLDNDWIHLYMELAVATIHRNNRRHRNLSNLKIVRVAMDTTDGEGLNAKNAIFYIGYLDEAGVDHIATVRRAINEHTGCFNVVGEIQSAHGFFSQRPQTMAVI